jgi:DNA invertase Pin-like site-specific DNA recombinase
MAIAERLEKADADLVSLSERIDTTTAAGRMVFRLLASLAEFERDQVSERTKMALAHKKRRGERVGRVPLGFELAADGKTLVPVAAELAVVKLVVELRAGGLSLPHEWPAGAAAGPGYRGAAVVVGDERT